MTNAALQSPKRAFGERLTHPSLGRPSSRRWFLGQIGLAGLSLAATPAWSEQIVKLPLAGDPRERPITNDFPQKRNVILQRTRPPLLETPLEAFDRGVFTPNEQFYVRWHWAVIPNAVDVGTTFGARSRQPGPFVILERSCARTAKSRTGCRQSMLRKFARRFPAKGA